MTRLSASGERPAGSMDALAAGSESIRLGTGAAAPALVCAMDILWAGCGCDATAADEMLNPRYQAVI